MDHFKHFFIIDDDSEFFCEAVTDLYPTAKCSSAVNGRDALEKLEAGSVVKPDIIFLDLNMPLMDGRGCLKHLRDNAKFKNIPVVIYTTSSSERDRTELLELGAQYFLSKPTSMKSLTSEIDRISSQYLSL